VFCILTLRSRSVSGLIQVSPGAGCHPGPAEAEDDALLALGNDLEADHLSRPIPARALGLPDRDGTDMTEPPAASSPLPSGGVISGSSAHDGRGCASFAYLLASDRPAQPHRIAPASRVSRDSCLADPAAAKTAARYDGSQAGRSSGRSRHTACCPGSPEIGRPREPACQATPAW